MLVVVFQSAHSVTNCLLVLFHRVLTLLVYFTRSIHPLFYFSLLFLLFSLLFAFNLDLFPKIAITGKRVERVDIRWNQWFLFLLHLMHCKRFLFTLSNQLKQPIFFFFSCFLAFKGILIGLQQNIGGDGSIENCSSER